jgi:dTDP-D-glucose 4,6-dehydratase
MSHVDNSFNDPKNFTLNNTYGTHVLLDKFREIKPNVEFIHFSTDEVYGESNTDVPFTEDVNRTVRGHVLSGCCRLLRQASAEP